VIEILSSRREYTQLNPLVVLLGKGDHQITSSWTDPAEQDDEDDEDFVFETMLDITRSNITFVGTGKDTTTILGGFRIDNQRNITFKNMTVTNPSDGSGIHMSNAKVELLDVALKGCRHAGLNIDDATSETTLVATRCEFANSMYGAAAHGSLTSLTFNNCLFHDNSNDGVYGTEATIHLHGEATAIHSNGECGIFAMNSCKVLIHLPTHHNTSYNNEGEARYTYSGGTITNVED